MTMIILRKENSCSVVSAGSTVLLSLPAVCTSPDIQVPWGDRYLGLEIHRFKSPTLKLYYRLELLVVFSLWRKCVEEAGPAGPRMIPRPCEPRIGFRSHPSLSASRPPWHRLTVRAFWMWTWAGVPGCELTHSSASLRPGPKIVRWSWGTHYSFIVRIWTRCEVPSIGPDTMVNKL